MVRGGRGPVLRVRFVSLLPRLARFVRFVVSQLPSPPLVLLHPHPIVAIVALFLPTCTCLLVRTHQTPPRFPLRPRQNTTNPTHTGDRPIPRPRPRP
jgi:hypothetical protein